MNAHLNDKKELWKSIGAMLAVLALYKVIGHFGPKFSDRFVDDLVWEIIFFAMVLAAAFWTKKLGALKWTSVGFGAGIGAGLYFVGETLVKLINWGSKLAQGQTDISVPAASILMYVVFCLLIGVAEELLYRGILLGGLLDYYGEGSVEALRKAVILAGLIFGASHLLNITNGSSPVYIVAAAISNAASGVLYGAVYVRAKRNIWPTILYHSVKDGTIGLMQGILCVTTAASVDSAVTVTPVIEIVGILVLSAVVFLVGMFIMRKKKLLPLVDAQAAGERGAQPVREKS